MQKPIADCLTILVEHKDLCEKHNNYFFEDLLFPKRWDENSVISSIINRVQSPSNLTKAQRNQAKDMAISAIQQNKEANYERFEKRVERDRKKNEERKFKAV